MISRHAYRSGFTLIEVALALSIVSFCLLVVFGLLPIGMNSNQNASEQTSAAAIATAISADLHSNPVVSGSTSRFHLLIPAAGGKSTQTLFFSQDGALTGAVNTNAVAAAGASAPRYRATIAMCAADTSNPPNPPRPNHKLFKVWMRMTWPALADPKAASTPANFSGSFESITALNCN